MEKDLKLSIEIERELDGRILAEIPALPGIMAYGPNVPDAIRSTQALALRHIYVGPLFEIRVDLLLPDGSPKTLTAAPEQVAEPERHC